jgi:serine/threonine-protein kinase RsbW
MNNDIDIEITVPNQTRCLNLIGKIGEKMAHELCNYNGNRVELGQHLNAVLTEALVNAIKHANATDPAKEVRIRIQVSNKEIMIRVFDTGKGFDMDSIAKADCPDPLNEQGRGIYIIRSLMDTVEYRRSNGGNVLEMKKALG